MFESSASQGTTADHTNQREGSIIQLSTQLKLMEVTLDAPFSLDGLTNSVCKESFFQKRALRHTRPSITEEMANCEAFSLVQYRLDYANTLYTVTSLANFDKLQRIQITLARVVTLTKKRDLSHLSCSRRSGEPEQLR